MNLTETQKIQCPYCGEIIEVIVDCSVPHQNYIEDCQVCCQPMVFDVTMDQDGMPVIFVTREDE